MNDLIDEAVSNLKVVSGEIQECIKVLSRWSEPSSIQKTSSKEFSRLLVAKIQEHNAMDLLLLILKDCIRCIKDCTGPINQGVFELTATLLSLLLHFDRVKASIPSDEPTGKEDVIQIRGVELYDYFIERLLAFKWRPENLIQTAIMIRDLKGLGIKRTQNIIDKIMAIMPQVSEAETPALIYQLLLLGRSNHDAASKEATQITLAVFKGIVGYFSTMEGMESAMEVTEEDRRVTVNSNRLECQCASHIVLALKHNQALSDEFLKHVKKQAKGAIPRFTLMILFSMTETFKFASAVPTIIRSNVLARLESIRIFAKHGDISGLIQDTYETLELSYVSLVNSFSFESESALKSLISVAFEMPGWGETNELSALSRSVLQSIFLSHEYAREELVRQIAFQCSLADSPQLALLLDEFYQSCPQLVAKTIEEHSDYLCRGIGYNHLAALTVKSRYYEIRQLLLSNEEEKISSGLEIIRLGLTYHSGDVELFKLVRFAVDRLRHRQELFDFLAALPFNEALNEYLITALLVDKANKGATNWNWPNVVTNCLDLQIGQITLQLPSLLLSIQNNKTHFDCCKNLFIILDNQAGVKWFADDEPTAAHELKRPLIVDLYDAAILLSLTGPHVNITRAFRLLNGQKDFLSGCINVTKASLKAPYKLLKEAIMKLIEDNTQTNGTDDLLKWLLVKLKGTTVDSLDHFIEEVFKFNSVHGAKLKSCFSDLVAVSQKFKDVNFKPSLLNWALEQKVPSKDLTILISQASYSDELAQFASQITANDTFTCKNLLGWLFERPANVIQAAKDCLALAGEIDAEEPDENSFGNEHALVKFKFITRKSLMTAVSLVVNWISDHLGQAEWVLKQIKSQVADDLYDKVAIKSLCKTLEPVIQVQVVLTRANISGPQIDRLQLCLQKTYRFASQVLAFLIALGKPFDLEPLKSLFDLMAGSLSPNVYTMIPLVQQNETEKARETIEAKRMKKAKGKGGSVAMTKSAKECRLLPMLIFNIEVFDKHILEISRKAGITLVDQIHRSTARDFRIQTEELEAALQNFQLEALTDKDETEESEVKTEPIPSN